MSKGPWKPKDQPPDNQPTSVLAQIALKYEDLAAIDIRRAQVQGELSALFRSAQARKSGTPSEHGMPLAPTG